MISCIMPTYGKIPQYKHLLEEALQAFLDQDHEDKELIICNDNPEQQLIFDHPKVLIINSPRRFRTLGEKLNAMIGVSRGEYICRWDDDDISLPNRLSYTLHKLLVTDANYWKSQDYFHQKGETFEYHNKPHVPVHGKAIWTREAYEAAKGHRIMNSGQDVKLEHDIRTVDPDKYITERVGRDDAYFIYRWGMWNRHLSGKPGRYEEMEEIPQTPGSYVLSPHYRYNYAEIVNRLRNGENEITV